MSLILSLLIFSLRIAFSFGNAVEEALPTLLFENKESVEVAPVNDHFAPIIIDEQSHWDAVIEENSEEESENEQLATICDKPVTYSLKKSNKTALLAGLNSKAKQGNLHLYDLFHSWKEYLS
jgi:hypothetical protein